MSIQKPFSLTKLTKLYDWMIWTPPEHHRACEWSPAACGADAWTTTEDTMIILCAGTADEKDFETALRNIVYVLMFWTQLQPALMTGNSRADLLAMKRTSCRVR